MFLLFLEKQFTFLILMKILSNFDTHLAEKLYLEYVQLFWKEYVAVVNKSRYVWYTKIYLPLIGYGLVVIACIAVLYAYPAMLVYEWVYRLIGLLMAVWWLWLFIKISTRYIDLKLDFLIVTPKEVMKYNQEGVFSRVTEKISADKIKSITIQKSWFLASFFDVGSLVFLAEGQSEEGDIVMDYIDAVEATEKHLRHILRQDTMT